MQLLSLVTLYFQFLFYSVPLQPKLTIVHSQYLRPLFETALLSQAHPHSSPHPPTAATSAASDWKLQQTATQGSFKTWQARKSADTRLHASMNHLWLVTPHMSHLPFVPPLAIRNHAHYQDTGPSQGFPWSKAIPCSIHSSANHTSVICPLLTACLSLPVACPFHPLNTLLGHHTLPIIPSHSACPTLLSTHLPLSLPSSLAVLGLWFSQPLMFAIANTHTLPFMPLLLTIFTPT
jgi:hypothetical protein